MTSALVDELSGLYDRIRGSQIELLTRQLKLERRLATLIEDAYCLTQEERGLIRATCSVSDPFDVLEAKICGADADIEPEQEGSEGD